LKHLDNSKIKIRICISSKPGWDWKKKGFRSNPVLLYDFDEFGKISPCCTFTKCYEITIKERRFIEIQGVNFIC